MPQTAPLPAARLVNRPLVGTPLLGAKPQQYASPSARSPQVPLLAVSVVNVPGTFTSLTASNGTCGLLADGEAYCWGFAPSKGVPTSGRFTSLAAGSGAVCGITTTQSIA